MTRWTDRRLRLLNWAAFLVVLGAAALEGVATCASRRAAERAAAPATR